MQPEAKIAQYLEKHKKTLSTAESCSGGLLANRLTNVPGSSKYFQLGIVAYSNEAKMNILGIPEDILKKYGAVSKPTAILMARRARELGKTDYGIGITGIAGPSGGTKKKPVGLVYLAFAKEGVVACKKCLFHGSRLSIKRQTTQEVLKIFYNFA